MAKVKNVVGEIYNGRIVIEFSHRANKRLLWKFECLNCGNVIIQRVDTARINGCYCSRINSRTSHGKHGTPTYNTWDCMIQRCTNPNNTNYASYGALGVTVCDRWLNSFEAFYEDMGARPKGKTLDRKDPTGDYNKGNCRWATPQEQARNKREHLREDVGVIKNKVCNTWIASISLNNKNYRTHHKTKLEAMEGRKLLEKKYWT